MEQWRLVADIDNVLRPCPITLDNVGFKDGALCADDVILPDTDCRLVGAVVLHECNGLNTDGLLWISTEPEVRQSGSDAVICVRGFSLDAHGASEPANTNSLAITKDMGPCERADVLECCYDELICGINKVSVSFYGRQSNFGSGDVKALRSRIDQLRHECEMCGGKPAPVRRRSAVYRCVSPRQLNRIGGC